MKFSPTVRLIVSILTLLTNLAIISGMIYALVAHLPIMLVVVGLLMLPAFCLFSYNDYMHYFKNKE